MNLHVEEELVGGATEPQPDAVLEASPDLDVARFEHARCRMGAEVNL